MDTFVFDTGPLSHFARADILGVLRMVIGPNRAIIPDSVVTELKHGVSRNYRIQAVLDAEWIQRRALSTTTELTAFARFASRLVSDDRNVGDAAVLALSQTLPARAVIDDWHACAQAKKEGSPLHAHSACSANLYAADS